MSETRHDWVILLAGGRGARLRGWAGPDGAGDVPKPYRCLVSGMSLLDQAVARARRLVPVCRMVIIVAADHRSWWQSSRAKLPGATWLVQDVDRGTGGAILSALALLLLRDPEAVVTVMPIDQAIDDEEAFVAAVRCGRRAVSHHPELTILLGSAETRVDDGYGWIVPGASLERGLRRVERFIGRPRPDESPRLTQSGALADTFLVTAAGRTLLSQFHRADPVLIDRYLASLMDVGGTPAALMRLEASLPPLDFSRWYLEPAARRGELAVTTLPSCGWTDIGTPERVTAWHDRHSGAEAAVEARPGPVHDGSASPSRRM